MTTRFARLFDRLAAAREGAFVPFVTLGDPDLRRSRDIIKTLADNGADALELGFPFSDPLLDGPVIQAANHRALDAGSSTAACFRLLADIRAAYPEMPISLLLCANLIHAQGLDAFYQRCADSGVDAVLVADIPLIAAADYIAAAQRHRVQPVFICPPNADGKTIARVAAHSEGYVYLVSRAGVTSADNQSHAANLDTLVEQLKAHHAAPILQGFGIARPEQVAAALAMGVNGAISGSATVKIIEQHLDNHPQCLAALAAFVRDMKAATRFPPAKPNDDKNKI